MQVPRSYLDRLNQAMEARHVSPDDLARRSGYPLDLVEPLLRGEPELVSPQMNDELCEVLGLDAAEMWALARGERQAAARPVPRNAPREPSGDEDAGGATRE